MASIIFDVIVLIVFVGCAIFYGSRGFVASILDLVGNVASIIMAYFAGNHFSVLVFNTWFRKPLIENTLTLIQDAGVGTLEELLPRIVGFLPHSVIENMITQHKDVVVEATAPVANLIVNDVIAPIIIPLLALIIFLIIFLVFRLLLGLLASFFKGLNKAPVLGGLNRALGVAVGLLVAFLYVLIAVSVIWVIDVAYGGANIVADVFSDSIVYKLLRSASLFKNAPFLKS